jgi:N-formylglutamate amidohydrolase
LLLQVLQFLQVQPPKDMAPLLQAGQAADVTAGVPPMLPVTRQRLQHFYQPYNQQLADLLSDTKYSEWT